MPISTKILNKYATPKFDWFVDTCGYQPNYSNELKTAIQLLKKCNTYIRDNELSDEVNEFLKLNETF